MDFIEYSVTAYLDITEQHNLDLVPDEILDLWYSSPP